MRKALREDPEIKGIHYMLVFNATRQSPDLNEHVLEREIKKLEEDIIERFAARNCELWLNSGEIMAKRAELNIWKRRYQLDASLIRHLAPEARQFHEAEQKQRWESIHLQLEELDLWEKLQEALIKANNRR